MVANPIKSKLEPVLNLFRESEIKEAFRQAFDKNNPKILLQESDRFQDWNILGDELRELEINPRKEFAAFASGNIKAAKGFIERGADATYHLLCDRSKSSTSTLKRNKISG